MRDDKESCGIEGVDELDDYKARRMAAVISGRSPAELLDVASRPCNPVTLQQLELDLGTYRIEIEQAVDAAIGGNILPASERAAKIEELWHTPVMYRNDLPGYFSRRA